MVRNCAAAAFRNACTVPANHSPYFYIDETGLQPGLRALLQVAVDYLNGKPRS